ncbi:MAG: hypothetical protein AB7P04_10430 [Bacteriovoracia bacterium]
MLMSKKHLLPLVALLVAVTPASASILPENSLHLYDDPGKVAEITEEQFNQIIDRVIDLYKPVVALHGGELSCEKKWKDGTVNAYASRDGKVWTVSMFGGLARRKEVTPDGFALVVCHELGHHLGGFPFYPDEDWAASEGQSDYYATQVCGRKLWQTDYVENAKAAETVDKTAKAQCDKNWLSTESRNLCYRIANGSLSLATLLGVLGGTGAPKFDTPDMKTVKQTNPNHPAAQCRLDTYMAGARCGVRMDTVMIPGVAHAKGQDSMEAEKVSTFQACVATEGFADGVRPACWFKTRY